MAHVKLITNEIHEIGFTLTNPLQIKLMRTFDIKPVFKIHFYSKPIKYGAALVNTINSIRCSLSRDYLTRAKPL